MVNSIQCLRPDSSTGAALPMVQTVAPRNRRTLGVNLDLNDSRSNQCSVHGPRTRDLYLSTDGKTQSDGQRDRAPPLHTKAVCLRSHGFHIPPAAWAQHYPSQLLADKEKRRAAVVKNERQSESKGSVLKNFVQIQALTTNASCHCQVRMSRRDSMGSSRRDSIDWFRDMSHVDGAPSLH